MSGFFAFGIPGHRIFCTKMETVLIPKKSIFIFYFEEKMKRLFFFSLFLGTYFYKKFILVKDNYIFHNMHCENILVIYIFKYYIST